MNKKRKPLISRPETAEDWEAVDAAGNPILQRDINISKEQGLDFSTATELEDPNFDNKWTPFPGGQPGPYKEPILPPEEKREWVRPKNEGLTFPWESRAEAQEFPFELPSEKFIREEYGETDTEEEEPGDLDTTDTPKPTEVLIQNKAALDSDPDWEKFQRRKYYVPPGTTPQPIAGEDPEWTKFQRRKYYTPPPEARPETPGQYAERLAKLLDADKLQKDGWSKQHPIASGVEKLADASQSPWNIPSTAMGLVGLPAVLLGKAVDAGLSMYEEEQSGLVEKVFGKEFNNTRKKVKEYLNPGKLLKKGMDKLDYFADKVDEYSAKNGGTPSDTEAMYSTLARIPGLFRDDVPETFGEVVAFIGQAETLGYLGKGASAKLAKMKMPTEETVSALLQKFNPLGGPGVARYMDEIGLAKRRLREKGISEIEFADIERAYHNLVGEEQSARQHLLGIPHTESVTFRPEQELGIEAKGHLAGLEKRALMGYNIPDTLDGKGNVLVEGRHVQGLTERFNNRELLAGTVPHEVPTNAVAAADITKSKLEGILDPKDAPGLYAIINEYATPDAARPMQIGESMNAEKRFDAKKDMNRGLTDLMQDSSTIATRLRDLYNRYGKGTPVTKALENFRGALEADIAKIGGKIDGFTEERAKLNKDYAAYIDRFYSDTARHIREGISSSIYNKIFENPDTYQDALKALTPQGMKELRLQYKKGLVADILENPNGAVAYFNNLDRTGKAKTILGPAEYANLKRMAHVAPEKLIALNELNLAGDNLGEIPGEKERRRIGKGKDIGDRPGDEERKSRLENSSRWGKVGAVFAGAGIKVAGASMPVATGLAASAAFGPEFLMKRYHNNPAAIAYLDGVIKRASRAGIPFTDYVSRHSYELSGLSRITESTKKEKQP